MPSPAARRRVVGAVAAAASAERAAARPDVPADAEPRAVVGVGVNDCDAFVATVRIAELVEVLGINGSVVL